MESDMRENLPDISAALVMLCTSAPDADSLIRDAPAALVAATGARSVTIYQRVGDADTLLAAAGTQQEPFMPADDLEPGRLQVVSISEALRAGGVTAAAVCRLPGSAGLLEMTWADSTADAESDPSVCTALLCATLAQLQARAELADLMLRVDSAQQLANMGDYDWHIATDTNRWSDQLYRIYGHEPQTFNASYQRFLDHIHPDDRDKITEVHQQAYATGEPYQMVERIVRADGQLRYLASNGAVILDESGTPVRMRGTCIDITDRVLAENSREHLAARFRSLVESSPDAILVYTSAGEVVQANAHAAALLGGDPVGVPISQIAALTEPACYGLSAVGLDGRQLTLDATTANLSDLDGESLTAAFLRDATPRLRNEAVAVTLHEAEIRRRQALELNDNVVQGLTAIAFSLTQGDMIASTGYVDRTMAAARTMMNRWLDPLSGDGLKPGDLVRESPSTLPTAGADQAVSSIAPPPDPRILIVDDNADIRELVRIHLEHPQKYEIVGEAADGRQAVDQARELQPDIVLLDLAMPNMDGLEALPLIRDAVPGVQIIVLSAFDKASMAPRVLDAGAARYVEKGLWVDLPGVIDSVLAAMHAA